MQKGGLNGAWEVNGAGGGAAERAAGGGGSGGDGHWSRDLRETVLCADPERLPFSLVGGSEAGQFGCIADVHHQECDYVSGRLQSGEVLVEVQGQQVGGYTRRDITTWLQHCLRNGNACVIKTARQTPGEGCAQVTAAAGAPTGGGTWKGRLASTRLAQNGRTRPSLCGRYTRRSVRITPNFPI